MSRGLTVKISGKDTSEIFKLLDILGREYQVLDMSRLKDGDENVRVIYADLEKKEE